MSSEFTKDPDAILDYRFDWSDWLGTDTISTSTFTVPSGLTKESESKTTTTTTIWLSGGTVGQHYGVANRIVTAGGRTEDRSIMIHVTNR
jgi:hypothetical protein